MTLSQVSSETTVNTTVENIDHKDVEKGTDFPGRLRMSGDTDVVTDTDVGMIRGASDPAFRRGSSTSIPDKTLGPYQAAVIFITNEIGIGILSLPSALQVLGIVPGVILIILMGLLSLYSGYILIQFYRRYPTVINVVDYGRILGGRPLEFVFSVGFIINLVLFCASAVITMSIGLNTITNHAACTIAFMAIPTIICWLLCIPRTMKFVAWCGWPCTVSIISAVMIVMISLGVSGPQYIPPQGITIKIVGNPTFTQATSAFLNIAFAYTGNLAFPSVLAEMRNPSRDFPKAIAIEKCSAIVMYCIVAITCYSLAGDSITSPAIGSAPALIAKIAYGIIFVSLFGTGLVFGHTAVKYLHVLVTRQILKAKQRKIMKSPTEKPLPSSTNSMKSNSASSWALWIGIATAFWTVAFIVTNVIPAFNSLLNISASLLVAWFTWGFPAIFWLHLNWDGLVRNWRKRGLLGLNLFMLAVTLFMNTGGMYASVAGLLGVFRDPSNSVNGAFSCGDNSIL